MATPAACAARARLRLIRPPGATPPVIEEINSGSRSGCPGMSSRSGRRQGRARAAPGARSGSRSRPVVMPLPATSSSRLMRMWSCFRAPVAASSLMPPHPGGAPSPPSLREARASSLCAGEGEQRTLQPISPRPAGCVPIEGGDTRPTRLVPPFCGTEAQPPWAWGEGRAWYAVCDCIAVYNGHGVPRIVALEAIVHVA